MNALHIKNTVLAVLAATGSAVAQALGGWDVALKVLICFMALDYVTGWLVAAVWHKSAKSKTGALDSKASYKGLVKKGVMLALVWMAALLDQATGSDFARDAVCMFFIANEGLSILENTAVMGVPYPAFIKNMLDAIHQASDQGERKHGGSHMSTRAGTVPLSDLQFLKIYFNRKRLRSTTANLKKMLAETGGDAICNGSIFLRNQQSACHLKADGKVYKAPDYRAWAISWNTPADFGVKTVPNGDANYMECVHLIIGGKKINPVTCGADMRYRAPRTAIGTKNGRFAYYVSKDRRTPEQLRDLLAASGWDNAIMMDGGGSTCFMDSEGKGFTGDGRVIPFFLVWKKKSGDACEPEGEKPMVEINAYSKAKDGDKKLSTNFKVKEFACKDGSDAVLVAPRLVMVLQSLRSHFCAAVTINSAYRTPQYNAKEGGVTDSQHCYGTAADIVVRGKTPAQVAAYARQLMPDWGGVGVYAKKGFTHIDVREAKADWNG